jgi:hypothetical protein
MEKSDKNIVYNYFKIIDNNGEVYGVGATEKGTNNEVMFIEGLFNLGCKVIKITKQEYEDFEDYDEISNL